MPDFMLQPHFSTGRMQRLADRVRPRVGTYYVPILEAEEEDPMLFTIPILDRDHLAPEKPEKLECYSRLLELPSELLVHIMLSLPHSSLYMVRRTCRVLLNLTDDFQFKAFQTDILRQGGEHSCLTRAGSDELRMIKRILLRSTLCGPCGRLFDSGELKRRLRGLWYPVACIGCRQYHPAFLFPQERHGGLLDGRTCVGLMGKLSICKHLKVTGQMKSCPGGVKSVHCTDPEHVIIGRKDTGNLPAFQNYRAGISIESGHGLVRTLVSKSFPLAKVDYRQYPGLEVLKRHLMKQLRELDAGNLCLHAWSQLDSIVSSIGSDECNGFPASELPVFHGPRLPYIENIRCHNHEYLCRHCGACYFWSADTDYIVLHVRIRSRWLGPDRKDWLSNLTFDSEHHPVLNFKTEGILWCANPCCGTGYDHRWLAMVDIYEKSSLHWYYPNYDRLSRCWDDWLDYCFSLDRQMFEVRPL